MPIEVITQSEVAEVHALRCRMVQDPIANLVFRQVDRRHERQDDIMQRDTDRGCDFVAVEQPGDPDGEQCLHAPQRSESEENTDRHPKRDRVRRVRNGNQTLVVRSPPIPETGKPTQTGPRRSGIFRTNLMQKALPVSMAFLVFVRGRRVTVTLRAERNRDCYY